MVDEGFCLARALRDPEDMSEEFFEDEEVWLGREGCVEGEDGAGAFEAVARKVEFRHGMYWVYPLALVLCRRIGSLVQFWRCILTVGPLGALLIHM